MKSIHRTSNTVQQSTTINSNQFIEKREAPTTLCDSFTSPFEAQPHLKQPHGNNVIKKYRTIKKEVDKLWGKPSAELQIPHARWEAVNAEEEFKEHPTVSEFLRLAEAFSLTRKVVGHEKYQWMERLAIDATPIASPISLLSQPDADSTKKLEHWHHEHEKKFNKEHEKACQQTHKRHVKIEEKGLGYGGKMTSVIGKSKAFSFHAKNNYTIRGNMFKLTHATVPKNLDEIMPRFGYRKGAHVGVRVTQFTLNGFITGLGYALIPLSFGISKIVADHLTVVVTLSGESITHKIAGAGREKIAFHAGLRGVQLEVPRLIPIVGDVINIGENIAMGSAAAGIVGTTIADAILQKISTRYQSTMNLDDLGDSSCLEELNHRIDYLSRFLLPYGQYLLLHESDIDLRKELKHVLKKQFKKLRSLEKKKMESLNFYRLALAAEKVPKERREKIATDCERAVQDLRVNTHRRVRTCLARLMEREEQQTFLFEDEKMAA